MNAVSEQTPRISAFLLSLTAFDMPAGAGVHGRMNSVHLSCSLAVASSSRLTSFPATKMLAKWTLLTSRSC